LQLSNSIINHKSAIQNHLQVNAQIKQNIKADVHRLYPGRFTYRKLLKGLRNKGIKYMFFMRLSSHSNVFIKVISRVIHRLLSYRYGFQIYRTTPIDGGFFIGHFGTIVISDNAVIGRNCNIAHGCTIGRTKGPNEGSPKIGAFVWIGTGAVIVGKIQIGNHVMIAPNAYVNVDVPSHSLVIGNPSKIISKQNPTKNYINNAWMD